MATKTRCANYPFECHCVVSAQKRDLITEDASWLHDFTSIHN